MSSGIVQLIQAAMLESDARNRMSLKYSKERKKAFEEQVGAIENTLISPRVYYYVVDLRDEPVSFDKFTDRDPNVISTQGLYTIRYIPTTQRGSNKAKPFQIGQDLIRWRIMCSGPAHWKCLAKRIPELGWLDRNTTLTRDMFAMAKRHPSMAFFFTIKWDEYSKKIIKKAEEMGVDIDNKPFVAYKCSQQDFKEKYSKKHLAEKKQFYHYMKEINEAEKESIEHGE